MTDQPSLFGGHLDRGSGQTDGEDHYTPPKLVRRCVDLLPWPVDGVTVEPSGGGGAFMRKLEDRRIPYLALDSDPGCWAVQNGAILADWLTWEPPQGVKIGRVLGNPAFSVAEAHVDKGLELAPEVAFLLPVGRWDAAERADWYQTRPLRHVWLMAERIWGGSRQCGLFWFDRSWKHNWWKTEIVRWKS